MKKEILAVHKLKLEDFLKGLGYWELLRKGELKCSVCGNVVTLDNLGFIIPSGREVLFCCQKVECISHIHSRVAEGVEVTDED
jgi:hypothetical protein